MHRAMHIAVLTADAAQATEIRTYLSDHGFAVTLLANSYGLDRMMRERSADLVIVDDNLPDIDPIALTRRLSARNRLGILILASGQDCLARICGLEAGADDCLAKPVELRELLARAKAILRRLTRARDAEQADQLESGVNFGGCRFDASARRLSSHSGAPVPVTDMELSLLSVFAEHPNRALSRDELVRLAYGRSWSPFDRSLDIRISRLRHKLERDPARPEVIVTVRGIGYRYEAVA
jgi:DNA-binding response OmpR family regulator